VKILVATGVTALRYTRWRSVQRGKVRSFATSPYAKSSGPGMDWVGTDWTLKSGTRYFYRYNPPQPTGIAVGLVNNLSHVGAPLLAGLTGGRLYNAIIRPQLWYKDPTTP
jgi:hypothetical protein